MCTDSVCLVELVSAFDVRITVEKKIKSFLLRKPRRYDIHT